MTWTGGGLLRGANFTDLILPDFDFSLFRVNTTNNFYFRGGDILGGLKVTIGNYGVDGDEITHESKTYFMITSLTSNSNNRMSPTLLIPKE